MPIGTALFTSISLSTLRGEFGGATPDSLSEYYANSAYSARGVMSGQRGYPSGVSTAIPSSGQISFSNFFASRKLTPQALGFTGTYVASGSVFFTTPVTSYAGIVIEQDGGSSVNLEGADGNSYVTTQTWLTAKELASIGNSFWVRFTLSTSSNSGSGTYAIDGTTGWLQLSTFRTRFVQATATQGGAFQNKTANATYAIDIASDSGGTNIVSSSSINLQATSTYEG